MISKFFFILIFTLMAETITAFSFHHITVEMGLSNSTTFSVIKDEKGLMWFSTKEGIDRYDGTQFKNYVLYKPTEITKYGLRRNKFYNDDNMNIWVYNFYEVFIYNRQKDKFDKKYSVDNNNTIRDLFVDNKQGIVFLATDKGLICYDYNKNISYTYPDLSFPIITFTKYSENLLISVHNNAISFLNIKTKQIEKEILSTELINQISKLRDISGACIDKNKNIYLASLGQVSLLKPHDTQLRTNPLLNKEIDKTVITKIVADKNGAIFLGTPGKGLLQIDSLLNLQISYYTKIENTNINEVSDIFIEENNRLWISGYGISYLNSKELNFQYYKNNVHATNCLYHNEVRSFIEDKNNNLWIGTNSGISILSNDRKTWSNLSLHDINNKLSSNKITALTMDDSGNIIAGTSQGEIIEIDSHHSVTLIGTNGYGVYKTGINDLLIDDDELWYGGAGSYLGCKNLKSGIVQTFPVTNVLCIIKSKNGKIITGGHNGIHLISHKNDIKNYDASKYNIGSIFCIVEDNEHNLWLASEGQGLIKFNLANESFKKYTSADGLLSDLVYGILPDTYGYLWLSTTKGISCFNIQQEIFRNYTPDDGLPIKEFTYGSYGQAKNGEILFGSNNGFLIFNPKELLDFDLKTNLIFTDFKIFNKKAPIGTEGSPLTKSIDETKSIKLAYNQSSITFEFSSVNLVNKANYYRWKLEGLEHEWSPITKENYANYTNLKPGKYTFIVQSINTNIQSEIIKNTRQIDIEIAPPFWKTIYAYLIYFILIAGAFYIAIKFYLTKLSENQAKDRIKFFVNIVHDIRTPLSLIKAPLKIAIKKKDFSDETLEVLKKANNNVIQLTKLVDQLLDFDSKDLKKSKLKLSYVNIEQTLNRICENFIPLMEQRGIILTQNHQQTETILPVDIDKLDKILFNLLSNAVKYTKEKGHIHLETSIVHKKFLISIADDGIGIPQKEQKYIFKRYFRVKNATNSNNTGFGIGLMIAKELIELHGGEIWFESTVNKGTTFYLTFPINVIPATDKEVHVQTESPDNAPTSELTNEEELPNNRRPKIIIAEDNDELRNLMVSQMKDEFKIIAVKNGAEGLKVVNKTSVDAIVSDIMMPIMEGTEFCFEVKNDIKTSHIPFILLTALSSNEHKTEGYKIGADVYMDKPVDIDLLINCIKNLLINREKIKEKFIKNEAIATDSLNDTDRKFVDQVMKMTERNISNPNYSTEDLEREIGISHAGLYRKFKKIFNTTPLEFVQHYRLKKSVELLQSENYNVSDVAYMVGFSDPKYFSIVFKKYYGKNASDFLKEKRLPLNKEESAGSES